MQTESQRDESVSSRLWSLGSRSHLSDPPLFPIGPCCIIYGHFLLVAVYVNQLFLQVLACLAEVFQFRPLRGNKHTPGVKSTLR